MRKKKAKSTSPEPQVARILLNPGELLVIKLISEDNPDLKFIEAMKNQFDKSFPNNEKVFMHMYPGNDVSFTIIKDESKVGCGPQTCADCNCGKKQK